MPILTLVRESYWVYCLLFSLMGTEYPKINKNLDLDRHDIRNLPWFMNITFQVPTQNCSLQHQTLLPSPDAATTGHCFYFDSISSFFLGLFLHSSPVACWALTDLGSSSFSVISFSLFILFMGFSRQEYWSGLPLSSPVEYVLSELSTMTHPSWVALPGMVHSFIELDKAVIQVKRKTSIYKWYYYFSFTDERC